jgi:hypothetical protein
VVELGAKDAVLDAPADQQGGDARAHARRLLVAVEASVLVVVDDEQRVVPIPAAPECLVHLVHERLRLDNSRRRVVVVRSRRVEVRADQLDDVPDREVRIDPRDIRQVPVPQHVALGTSAAGPR